MVTKGGFVQAQFGQRRPGEPGTPIDLGDGQTAEKVNFQLSRGGVISGRIVDDGGEPVSGTQVAAMRYQFIGGTRRLVPGGSEGGTDRTDDQGGFRLYGLPPGDYYVSANNRNNMLMMPGMNNTEADGVRADLLSRHAESQRSDARDRQGRPGDERRQLRADRGAHGARPRPRASIRAASR